MATLVLHGDAPWRPTATAAQMRLVAGSLRAAGHNVMLSVSDGLVGRISWNGNSVVGSPSSQRSSLCRWVVPAIERGEVAAVLTLCDPADLHAEPVGGLPVASWLRVRTDPVEDSVVQHARVTGNVVAVPTRRGVASLAAAGIVATHLPPSIDTTVFRPLVEGDRAASRLVARREIGTAPDAFIIGFVGDHEQAVPGRGGFAETVAAVGLLAGRRSDVVLHVHGDVSGPSMPSGQLAAVLAQAGVDRANIRATTSDDATGPWSNRRLAVLLNSFDVVSLPASHSSFGRVALEAQACGLPVVCLPSSTEARRVGPVLVGREHWSPHERRWVRAAWIEELADALGAVEVDDDAGAAAAVEFAAGFDHVALAPAWEQLAVAAAGAAR